MKALAGFLVVALLAWLAAAAAMVMSFHQTRQERDIVVRFVCASIAVRRETHDPNADLYAARMLAIIHDVGSDCE